LLFSFRAQVALVLSLLAGAADFSAGFFAVSLDPN